MPSDKKRVLLAEDEKSLSKAMQLKLSKADIDVTAVANGEELLEVLKGNSFDLIVMDLIMPKKDGFSTLETLREQKNTIPVIVTSNLGQDEDVKRAKDLGAIDYLIKSNTPIAEIVSRIESHLGA